MGEKKTEMFVVGVSIFEVGDYPKGNPIGVFSSEKKAQEFIDETKYKEYRLHMKYNGYFIKKFSLDEIAKKFVFEKQGVME